MILTIQVSDELYQAYSTRNPKSPQKEMEETLRTFVGVAPKEPHVVLRGEALKKLRAVVGEPFATPEELVEKVEKFGRFRLGPNAGLTLSPGQRQRIEQQAKFFEQDPEKFLEQQVNAAVVRVVGA